MNHCPLMHHSLAIVCSVCTYFVQWVHFEHCASCYATIVFPSASAQNLFPAKLPSAPSKSLWWAKLTHISKWACKKALQAVFSSKISFLRTLRADFLVSAATFADEWVVDQWSSASLTSLTIHRPKSLRATEFFWTCIRVIVLYLYLHHSKPSVLYLYRIVFVFVFVFVSELDLAPWKQSAGQ